MSTFERAEEGEILDAMARQAGYELPDPAAEEVDRLCRSLRPAEYILNRVVTTPFVRHINRQRGGEAWHDPPRTFDR